MSEYTKSDYLDWVNHPMTRVVLDKAHSYIKTFNETQNWEEVVVVKKQKDLLDFIEKRAII